MAEAVASPEFAIDAKVVSEELQLDEEVMSAVLLSLKVPVAANCWVPPTEMDGFAGATTSETSALMEKLRPLDVPPPGAGLVTVTDGEPAALMSAAVIIAVSWTALTKAVVLGLPLKFTIELDMKPVPSTVRVNAEPPTIAPVGDEDVRLGTGLLFRGVDPPPQPAESTIKRKTTVYVLHGLNRFILPLPLLLA
jgi:hypothetical protein